MRLFDTRTGAVHDFVAGHTVRMYVCGITPYDATHLGHAFTYTIFDVLARLLEHRGHRVLYARNITDVDDDILRRARELGIPAADLAAREVARFDRDLAALGLREPDVVPYASAAVPAIVKAVEGLLALGMAYRLDDGRIYFDTRASDRFGKLSKLDRATMLQLFGERGGDPDAPGKRDALDFLLWQPSAPDEPSWPSPGGVGPRGRPGWHIECSVMAAEELGSVIDIHGGGADLVYPHHEAEVVQAEHLTGQGPFARFWVHCAMVCLDGVKMSKSLGNLVFVGDLLERYEPAAVRRYLLSHHYRTPWSYSDAELEDAAAGVKRWRDAAGGDGERPDLAEAFFAALDDDLAVPRAIEVLDAAADARAGSTLRSLAAVLGFDFGDPGA